MENSRNRDYRRIRMLRLPTHACPKTACPKTACPKTACPKTACPKRACSKTACPKTACRKTTCPTVPCTTTRALVKIFPKNPTLLVKIQITNPLVFISFNILMQVETQFVLGECDHLFVQNRSKFSSPKASKIIFISIKAKKNVPT